MAAPRSRPLPTARTWPALASARAPTATDPMAVEVWACEDAKSLGALLPDSGPKHGCRSARYHCYGGAGVRGNIRLSCNNAPTPVTG